MQGQCLCGAVQVNAPKAREIGACHCQICRRWGGGPLLAVHAEPEDVSFSGTEHVAVYASSDWAERGFCRHCGTHLYYRLHATGQWFIPAGLLEGEGLEITGQIFIDSKPGYYALANQTPLYTGQEVLDMFAAAGTP